MITIKIAPPFAAGSGAEDVVFEAVPDFEKPGYSARLCRISIRNVGEGLPCVYHADTKSKEVYSKSEETKIFDDYGIIEIGQFCPVNYPKTDANSNKFIAQVAYEFPWGYAAGNMLEDFVPVSDSKYFQIKSSISLVRIPQFGYIKYI